MTTPPSEPRLAALSSSHRRQGTTCHAVAATLLLLLSRWHATAVYFPCVQPSGNKAHQAMSHLISLGQAKAEQCLCVVTGLHIAISLAFGGLIVLSNYYIYGNTLLVLYNGKRLLMRNCIL
jgi:hypothetical protein